MAENNNHFELNLDTIAPVGSIKCTTGEKAYIKSATALTVNFGDAAFYYVWFDKNLVTDASATKIVRKASAAECTVLYDAWEDRSSGSSKMKILTQVSPQVFTEVDIKVKTAESACTTQFSADDADGIYYYHIVLMDNVGNESIIYTTQPIILDRQAVVLTGATITSPDGRTGFTNSFTNTLDATYVTPTASEAPIDHFEITSTAIENSPDKDYFSVSSLPATITFKDDTPEGSVEVVVVAVDKAGNKTVTPAKPAIYFDPTSATAIVILKNADGTAVLPNWVNTPEFTAEIEVQDANPDVVAYKLWGDVTGKETEGDWIYKNPADHTAIYENPIVVSGLTFTNAADHSKDGEKTVYIKVMDKAGNVYPTGTDEVYDKTSLDTYAPTATLTAATAAGTNGWFSDRPGYNTVTVTPTVVNTGVDGKKSNIVSYVLKVNGTAVRTAIADSYTLTSADGFVVGSSNSITLTVTDEAGNETTSEAVTVKYDNDSTSVALGFSIDSLAKHWHNEHFGISLSNITDNAGAGVKEFKVWVDDTENFDVYVDTIPQSAKQVSYVSGSTLNISAANIQWEDTEKDNKYIHVVAFDRVDNRLEQHIAYGWDTTAPTVRFTEPTEGHVFTTPACTLEIEANDTVSNPAVMKITGDITTPDTDFVTYVAQKSVTLTSGDGQKTISIVIKDEAGNPSEVFSVKVELDETTPHADLKVRKPDDSAEKDSPSNVAEFAVRVSYTDDPLEDKVYYRLYGTNFTGSMDEFEEYKPDAGQSYKLITGLTAINEGQVVVNLAVKDNAGHVHTQEPPFTWVYDATAPEVTATGVDFHIVSKVHELRQGSTKFCDEVNFEFFIAKEDGTWDQTEKYQAFKVCAYKDKADAAQGSPLKDAAIPHAAGSLNMEATGLNQNTKINALIKGADYEAALVARGLTATTFNADGTVATLGTAEGIHYIVVYMQDAGGTWSTAASFAA